MSSERHYTDVVASTKDRSAGFIQGCDSWDVSESVEVTTERLPQRPRLSTEKTGEEGDRATEAGAGENTPNTNMNANDRKPDGPVSRGYFRLGGGAGGLLARGAALTVSPLKTNKHAGKSCR